MTEPLYLSLFDDAGMFPPARLPVDLALAAHARHRFSWYEEFVGPFVCNDLRVALVDQQVGRLGLDGIDVAIVVPHGIEAIGQALANIERCDRLRLRAVEAPLGTSSLRDAIAAGEEVTKRGARMFLEIPVRSVTDRIVHQLRATDLWLKLRTGGTTTDAFHTEEELARPIVLCAAELLPFKCTAGLHNAVRHRDYGNGFEHHGFLNIALATLAAAGTGNAAIVRDILAEQDVDVVAENTQKLSERDVTAIRALFASFGTCSVTEPLDDLISMRLVTAA